MFIIFFNALKSVILVQFFYSFKRDLVDMLTFIFILNTLFQVYTLMLFIKILSSWIPEASEYRVMHFISYYTDPYLNLFRRVIPPLGMFDLSPIVAFLCLNFIQNILVSLLASL